jgi:hypothetical protein
MCHARAISHALAFQMLLAWSARACLRELSPAATLSFRRMMGPSSRSEPEQHAREPDRYNEKAGIERSPLSRVSGSSRWCCHFRWSTLCRWWYRCSFQWCRPRCPMHYPCRCFPMQCRYRSLHQCRRRCCRCCPCHSCPHCLHCCSSCYRHSLDQYCWNHIRFHRLSRPNSCGPHRLNRVGRMP